LDTPGELPTPNSDEKTMATLAHALQLVGSWIAPLVIFLIRRESKFVSFHALQALLWQIVVMVLMMGGMVLWFIFVFSTIAHHGKPHPDQNFPAGFFVIFPVLWLSFMAFWVLNLVIAIVYAVKAGRGEWAAYPVIGSWVRRIVKP
jgi:uncharacterized protein